MNVSKLTKVTIDTLKEAGVGYTKKDIMMKKDGLITDASGEIIKDLTAKAQLGRAQIRIINGRIAKSIIDNGGNLPSFIKIYNKNPRCSVVIGDLDTLKPLKKQTFLSDNRFRVENLTTGRETEYLVDDGVLYNLGDNFVFSEPFIMNDEYFDSIYRPLEDFSHRNTDFMFDDTEHFSGLF